MRQPACRFPFLLVDRVIELEPEKYAVGYKNVTINDNFFPGHFPQRAIMPGKLANSPNSCHSAVSTPYICRTCNCSPGLSALICCSGVLQVEAMAQLGGILMIDPENESSKNNFFFGGVDNCKWRKPVVPGDCLVSAVVIQDNAAASCCFCAWS